MKKTTKSTQMLSNTLIKLNKYPTDLKDFPFNEFNLIETSEFPQESIGNRPLLQDKQKIPTPLETKAFSKETEPKNHCNCSRSQCLKLYCECFAKGLICNLSCRCFHCLNNEENQEIRENVVQTITAKNPLAFHTKSEFLNNITLIQENKSAKIKKKGLGLTSRGCKCKKSMCRKKYCECFMNKVKCSKFCKCQSCKNKDKSQISGYHHNKKMIEKTMKIEENNKIMKKTKFSISLVKEEEIRMLKMGCMENKRVHCNEITEDWLENGQNLMEINDYFKLY